jgi:hypothetical protein
MSGMHLTKKKSEQPWLENNNGAKTFMHLLKFIIGWRIVDESFALTQR